MPEWTPEEIIQLADEQERQEQPPANVFDATARAFQEPFSKPYVSPYADREIRTEGDIWKYAQQDIPNIASGLAVMFNYPLARVRQSLIGDNPTNVARSIFTRGPIETAAKHGRGVVSGDEEFGQQPLIQPDKDFPAIAKYIAETGSYLYNEHIKPLYDRLAGDNPEPAYKYITEHAEKALIPDLLTFGAPALLKTPVQLAGKVVRNAPKGAFLAPLGVRKANPASTGPLNKAAAVLQSTDKLPDIFSMDIFPEWMRTLTPSGKVTEYYRKQLQKMDAERLSKFMLAAAELDAAARQLPPNLTEAITAIAERTDPVLLDQYGDHPAVLNFLAVADKYNRAFAETFNVPLKQQFISRYGPMYLSIMRQKRLTAAAKLRQKLRDQSLTPEARAVIKARIQDLAKPLRFKDLNKVEHFRRMRKLMTDLQKSGQRLPSFVPIRGKIALGKQLSEVSEPMGGLTGRVSKVAKQVGLGEIEDPYKLAVEDLPGILKPRARAKAQRNQYTQWLPDHNTGVLRPITPTRYTGIRKPSQSSNMHQLIKGEVAEMYKYKAIRDYIALTVRSQPENIKGAGWVTFNLLDEMKQAAGPELAGQVEQGFRRQALPPTVTVPPKVADLLSEVISGQDKPKPYKRGMTELGKMGSMWARLHYGLNPVFGPVLAGQTSMINAAIPKTPAQAVGMLVAHLTALNPRAKDLLPPGALLSHSDLLIQDAALLQAGNKYLGWLNKKTEKDYQFHNYQRRATMLYLLLYGLDKKSPAIRTLAADALNADTAINRAVAEMGNPGELIKARKALANYMGDYSKAAYKTRREWQDIFPTIAWAAHAINLLKTVPIEHPAKTSMFTMLAKVAYDRLPEDAPDYLKHMGAVPLTDAQGEQLTGVNDDPLYFAGPHMDILGSGLEMLTGKVPSNINPLLNIMFATQLGVDVHTGRPYENPDYQRVMRGRFLRDRESGDLMPGDTKQSPAIWDLALQEIDPEIFRLLNIQATGGKEPSKWMGKARQFRGGTKNVSPDEEILRIIRMGAREGR